MQSHFDLRKASTARHLAGNLRMRAAACAVTVLRVGGVAVAVAALWSVTVRPTLADEAPLAQVTLGAALGRSAVNIETAPDGESVGFDYDHLGWEFAIGTRPLRLLGAEIEYVDLGRVSKHPPAPFAAAASGTPGSALTGAAPVPVIDARTRGLAAFAVGYLPLAVAPLDLLMKAGVARIESGAASNYFVIPIDSCFYVPNAAGCAFNFVHTYTEFAWGGGVDFNVSKFTLRAEFERFAAAGGHPSLLSVGFTWKLF